ncbi:transposase [Bremerella sp. JC770]|uniref:REP-associated tyrosine transposase n=1 Tax=Bremerella sp. JC770 TaxID=3232137 RepID=UPI003457CE32
MSDRRRTYDDQLYAHFVTFSCYKRRRLLDNDQPKRMLLGELTAQLTRQDAKCVGFVIMPDHVHAIVWFSVAGQLTRFLQSWKRLSSYHIRAWYRESNAQYFAELDMGTQFWTAKSFTFEIYSEAKLREKLDYMHMNPVRSGLVERTTDWKWSSARWYDSRQGVGVPIEWIA